MVDSAVQAYLHTIQAQAQAQTQTQTQDVCSEDEGQPTARDPGPVKKENLVVFDPDYHTDYPPQPAVHFAVPEGWRIVYLRGLHAAEVPLLLKRAKIVLDLAMPGPERLAGEAVLVGAVPVISSRWNGASPVDFQG